MKLPSSIALLTSLSTLFLSGCSNIREFPEIPENLESLDLSGTAIEEVPSLLSSLSRLSGLNLSNCKRLKSFPSSICNLGSLRTLRLSGCSGVESFHNLNSLPCLQLLDLSNCDLSEFPRNLSNLSSLEDLDLSKNNFESIPESIKHISQLKLLNISHCKRLRYFLDIPPCIKVLKACQCMSLETVPRTRNLWKPNVECWDFVNCSRLDQKHVNNIVEDAQWSIQLLANNADKDHEDKGQRSEFCFPGSEIPEWFFNKDVGSSSTLILSSNGHLLIGITFCAVIGCANSLMVNNVCCKCHFKATKGEREDYSFISHHWSGNHKDMTLDSDNVFLWFIYWERDSVFDEYCEASFEFSALDYSKKPIDVKKCGIHLLYSKESNKNLLSFGDENLYINRQDSKHSMPEDSITKRGREHCESGSRYNEKPNHKRIKRCSF